MTDVAVAEVSDRCATRYPVVLLHGLGFRDDMLFLSSWGRIPGQLRREGAQVSLGELDAWASYEANAALLKTRVEALLNEYGSERVNLVAHSKGGIEARFMISCLGMAPVVASLTTVCTPHRGTSAADAAMGLVGCPTRLVELVALLAGDCAPDAEAAIRELTRPAMAAFNERVKDAAGVCYRSYGAQMKHATDDPTFALSYWVVREHEGANDGMVAASSCRWGDFRAFITGDALRGVSHLEMVDSRQKTVAGVDIPAVYTSMVEELKQLGY